MTVKPIPDGYHSVTPYLVVPGVAKLIDFMKQVFDGIEIERMQGPDGRIAHAEAKIGDSIIMMGEPKNGGSPMPATLYVYVPDTDAVYKRALQAGATSIMEPADQFYGDRNAGVKDFCGNHWYIGTRIENVTFEELKRRMEAMGKK